MKTYKLVLFLILILFFSCNKNNQNPVPSIPFDITIDINLPSYYQLQGVGSWTYVNGGSRGIIIYRRNLEEFVAFDMSMNIMELCKAYELPVLGECGGMAMCATCQCYLESETPLDEQSDAELDMLDQAFFVKSNSRLGCQIQLSDEINGIILRLAPEA